MTESVYLSPVPPTFFPQLAVILLSIGIYFMGSFFVYEVTSNRLTRSLAKELTTALLASTFLGFGTLFLALTVGIYV
eukprot:m.7698 g.7698  ORF g.7698 m.7698 type:complete len:77 (-) comp6784_c0_seq1:2673-2903(-)